MVYPLDSNVTWESGKDDLTTYNFGMSTYCFSFSAMAHDCSAGKERIDHTFCSVCGTSIGAMSNDPNFFADNRAINVRTLKGVDVEKLKLRKVDGRSM